MRLWHYPSVKGSSNGLSTAFSVVAHVALIGAAVYGTGVSARQLVARIADRAASLHFLPPPDRRPSSDNSVERVQFMDIGAKGPVLDERPDGRVLEPAGSAKPDPAGGDEGNDVLSQSPAVALESPDSVYSILDVEETAVRTEGSAAPIYPPAQMKQGKEGSVFVRFVVDSSGRADSASVEVVRSTHPDFTQSVREALPLMLYTPASVGGRHVRQAVEQTFSFRITPSASTESTRTKPLP